MCTLLFSAAVPLDSRRVSDTVIEDGTPLGISNRHRHFAGTRDVPALCNSLRRSSQPSPQSLPISAFAIASESTSGTASKVLGKRDLPSPKAAAAGPPPANSGLRGPPPPMSGLAGPQGLAGPPGSITRLILIPTLTRPHPRFPSASANMNTSSMVTNNSWNTRASVPCTTITHLMSIPTMLTMIFPSRIMMITLMITILGLIRNLFAYHYFEDLRGGAEPQTEPETFI